MTEEEFMQMQEDDGTPDMCKEDWYSILENEDDY